jgi:hypothetical protein
LYGPEGSVIFDHLAVRHQVTPVMTAARAAIDQARRNEQPIIKIGNEFQPRDIMMNALRRHAAMARWDPGVRHRQCVLPSEMEERRVLQPRSGRLSKCQPKVPQSG